MSLDEEDQGRCISFKVHQAAVQISNSSRIHNIANLIGLTEAEVGFLVVKPFKKHPFLDSDTYVGQTGNAPVITCAKETNGPAIAGPFRRKGGHARGILDFFLKPASSASPDPTSSHVEGSGTGAGGGGSGGGQMGGTISPPWSGGGHLGMTTPGGCVGGHTGGGLIAGGWTVGIQLRDPA